VRTALERLDIGEDIRKQLRAGGIVDVEGIVEAGDEKLAKILGDAATAKRVMGLAKALLANTPRPTPPPPAPKPTPLRPSKAGKRGK
jgi:hypothetical protein